MKDKPVILVVDDEPQNIELLEAYLVPQGYEIVKAANGEEALGKLSDNPIDLILLDVVMPGMDGFEVIRRVRQDKTHRLLPIILVTVLRETEDRIKGIEAGCDDFISYPVDKMELFARVRSLLQVKAYNDLMSNYQKKLESEVTRRTAELKHALENLQQDTTERKKAEKALRESEEKYRLVVDNMADVITVMDMNLGFTYVSPSIIRLRGYTAEEVMAQSLEQIMTPESLQLVARVFEEEMKLEASGTADPGRTRILELEEYKKDGSTVWLENHLSFFRDKEKKLVGIIALSHDITERKRAEEKLRESEKSYRDLFENANEAIFVAQGGKLVFFNPRTVMMSGYSAEELGSRPYIEFIHPEDRDMFIRRHVRRMKGEELPHNYDIRIIHKDGNVRWVKLNVVAINWKGKPATLNFLSDITERKRAEEALVFNNIILRTQQEASLDGILVVDEKDIILSFNQRFVDLWGIPPDVMESKSDERALQAVVDKLASPEEFIRKVQHLHEIRDEICRDEIYLKDGRSFDRYTAPMLGAGGKYYGRVWYFRDITERKQAEKEREKLQAQLNQAQKMEAVGRLAGGVAHDFNNMLAVILGYTEMALGRVDPAQPLQADLKEIMNAAKRSAAIIRQLLAFARKQTIDPIVLDLNETVEGMLKMLRRLIGEDIDLVWRPDSGLWPVKMDPTQVEQLLANLCVNARDAIAQVGKITIETGNAAFDEAYCADHPGFVPGEYALLAISDDGRGMDRETQDKMFEPFFTTKELGQGTGLGLATVYGVVKQNNGFINVYSEPGKGTTFKIYLARQAVEDVEPQKKSEEAIPRSQGETVLVVEDEVSLLKLASEILDKLGYTVLTAGTPDKALRLVENYTGEIHLLMTDVILPEMNGRDLAKQIKAIRPAMKCLFMSGYTADVIAHRGMLDEGVQFIPKPFSMRELAAKVRTVLGSDEFPPVHGPRQFQGGER
jgi:PAS domain S-box-containing protein